MTSELLHRWLRIILAGPFFATLSETEKEQKLIRDGLRDLFLPAVIQITSVSYLGDENGTLTSTPTFHRVALTRLLSSGYI